MNVTYKTQNKTTEEKTIEIEDIRNCFFTHYNNWGCYREYFGQFQPDKDKKRIYSITIKLGGGEYTHSINVKRTDIHNYGLEINIKQFIEQSNNYKFEQISKDEFMKILKDVTTFKE